MRAQEADADEIGQLIRKVYDGMEHKEWFAADAESYIRGMLSSDSAVTYKALESRTGEMAGILNAYLPGDSGENMGHDVGFSLEQCRLSAHMDTMAVLPEYRGHHLQYQMLLRAERDLYDLGCRYFFATVHPDNHASKNTMLRLGYKEMATKEKYGGYLRNIMLKIRTDP